MWRGDEVIQYSNIVTAWTWTIYVTRSRQPTHYTLMNIVHEARTQWPTTTTTTRATHASTFHCWCVLIIIRSFRQILP